MNRRDVELIVNLDALTYAANKDGLSEIPKSDPRYELVVGDIADGPTVGKILSKYRIDHILHLAAESHVDRSIDNPDNFIITNILGTYSLLEEFKSYSKVTGRYHRFLHVSTDEVFGSLGLTDPKFSETTKYDPRSPYSASKAASDHIVRSYYHTYGMDTIITNCSNNYGPYQHPEKLIPTVIKHFLNNEDIPVYGNGQNIRDWIYVDDHCRGIIQALLYGTKGETYLFGANCEMANVELIDMIGDLIYSEFKIDSDCNMKFITDRPGHDARYGIDGSKAKYKLYWNPHNTLKMGLIKTISWYFNNKASLDGYSGERLGLKDK